MWYIFLLFPCYRYGAVFVLGITCTNGDSQSSDDIAPVPVSGFAAAPAIRGGFGGGRKWFNIYFWLRVSTYCQLN